MSVTLDDCSRYISLPLSMLHDSGEHNSLSLLMLHDCGQHKYDQLPDLALLSTSFM